MYTPIAAWKPVHTCILRYPFCNCSSHFI